MTSSIVTPIVLFLLFLLLSPYMNEALGTQMELGKLGEEKTNHPDQVMVQRIPRISIPRRFLALRYCRRYTRCQPPPLPISPKSTNGLGH